MGMVVDMAVNITVYMTVDVIMTVYKATDSDADRASMGRSF